MKKRTAKSVPSGEDDADLFSATSTSVSSDPFLEGFAEGRRSMARSIALKLSGQIPDGDLASLLGLSEKELVALVSQPPTPRPEQSARNPDSRGRVGTLPRVISGLTLVEPVFIRTVRSARRFTQPELAARVDVHPRTVCEWENASGPVRMHTETYRKLAALAGSLK